MISVANFTVLLYLLQHILPICIHSFAAFPTFQLLFYELIIVHIPIFSYCFCINVQLPGYSLLFVSQLFSFCISAYINIPTISFASVHTSFKSIHKAFFIFKSRDFYWSKTGLFSLPVTAIKLSVKHIFCCNARFCHNTVCSVGC